MARPVKIRACYREDSAYLIRFEGAVLKDAELPEGHREEMARTAHRLSILCMEADNLRKPKKR